MTRSFSSWRGFRPVLDRLEDRTMPSSFGQLPLAFEANQGQAAPQVNFLAHGGGYRVTLTAGDAVLDLGQGLAGDAVLHLQLIGANPAAPAVGQNQLVTRTNYLSGSNPSQWLTDIPNYGQVAYQNVYPGINVEYHGNQGQLEYDFVLAPGADPGAIRLAVQGTSGQSLNAQGNLVLHTAMGDVLEAAPTLYQQIEGTTHAVKGRFELEANGQFGFAVGAYDHSQPLVIDPTLSYATYMPNDIFALAVDSAGDSYVTGNAGLVAKLNPSGTALLYATYLGSSQTANLGISIAVDNAGDAYVTGSTGTGFPTTANALSRTASPGFVSVLNPSGSGLLYSTYIPGAIAAGKPGFVVGGLGGIALDGAGDAYVTGSAGTGLPTTAGAYQPTWSGSTTAAYLAKINPNLSGTASLLYCTYLGGTGGNVGTGVAVDSAGNAYLTGTTFATNFPTTAGAFQTHNGGGQDVFVARINPALSGAASLIYSTYLGGGGTDGSTETFVQYGPTNIYRYFFTATGPGIAVNNSGNAYVTGYTNSSSFPVTTGAYETNPGSLSTNNGVAFVTQLNVTGSGLVYSTYLGKAIKVTSSTPAPYITEGTAIVVDASGDAYVTGYTGSSNFPLVNAIQKTYGGYGDAFVTTFNPAGSSLLFSTYLGGSYSDVGLGIGLDASNNAYVAGITGSANFPVTPGAFQTRGTFTTFNGFVAEIDPPVEEPHSAAGSSSAGSPASVGIASALLMRLRSRPDASLNLLVQVPAIGRSPVTSFSATTDRLPRFLDASPAEASLPVAVTSPVRTAAPLSGGSDASSALDLLFTGGWDPFAMEGWR